MDLEGLNKWLRYETFLVSRLLSRNLAQHAHGIFMAHVLSSVRFLTKLTSITTVSTITGSNRAAVGSTTASTITGSSSRGKGGKRAKRTATTSSKDRSRAILDRRLEDYYFYLYSSLRFVRLACVHLTRVHVQRHFAPLTSVLIASFSRILMLLLRVVRVVS